MAISGTTFGKAAADYGTFRAGFPESLFDRLIKFDVGLPGQRVVDLGTGTGNLARGFALRGCQVTGVDVDPQLIAEARKLDAHKGVNVRYVEAKAEATTLVDSAADVVTAGQCWHWFDRPAACVEVIRVLKRGTLVIAHFDWLPLPGNVVEATEKLIEQHNADWNRGGGFGMYPEWLPELLVAGFRGIETFSYDVDVPYTPEAWRGRVRASAGVTALEEASARRFDSDLEALLATRRPAKTLHVPHRVFAIVARAPP